MAEELVLPQDLVDHFLRSADEQSAARRPFGLELRPRDRRPPSLAPDARHDLGVRGKRDFDGALRRVGDKAVRVDADGQSHRIVAGSRGRFTVQLDMQA